MNSIVAEKVGLAVDVLNALDIDLWLTFVRETGDSGDPVLSLILGQSLTWQSALIITRGGDRIAIVGKYDDQAVRSTGVWTQTIPYVQSIREPLIETLERLAPNKIAINYSKDDVKADGLAHGMYLLLLDYLEGTPFAQRLIGANEIIDSVRGRKTPAEIDCLRAAIEITEEMLVAVSGFAKVGRTERDVASHLKQQAKEHNLGLAWDEKMCPIVNTGPDSMVGHGIPSTLKIEPGHIFHIDFGVIKNEYCSDLQRCWYVPKAGETAPPDEVCHAFETVVQAIQAAAGVLKPGIQCWEVDAAARSVVVEAGYPEYQHATGHQVGRHAHDGGGVLGPKWDRYGRTPYRRVEKGHIYTLELGIENIDGRGYLGLEEMVLVTDDGCEFLSAPQVCLPLLD